MGGTTMEWMLMPLRRYAEFQGRSRRKEYWMYTLFVVLIYVAAFIVFAIIAGGALAASAAAGGAPGIGSLMAMGGAAGIMFMLIGLVWLILFIPSLAVAFRRLHDIDRSGWWALVPTVLSIASLAGGSVDPTISVLLSGGSLIASLVLLVFFFMDGTRGPNRFGLDPKDPAGDLAQVFS